MLKSEYYENDGILEVLLSTEEMETLKSLEHVCKSIVFPNTEFTVHPVDGGLTNLVCNLYD